MKAQYARLFADSRGKPCFEDLSVELISGFAVPPAEPLHTAPFLVSDGATFWIGAPPSWNGGEPHPAPRRMIFITVRGEYEVRGFHRGRRGSKISAWKYTCRRRHNRSGSLVAHYECRRMHTICRGVAVRLGYVSAFSAERSKPAFPRAAKRLLPGAPG